jgi:hypothetical protein
MRLPTLAVLVSLAALAAADYMDVTTTCPTPFACASTGLWHTDFSSYYGIDANEGCRDPPGVPGLNSLCMDWENQRAHFFFDGQGKRCLKKGPDYDCMNGNCRSRWSEVACSWR